MIQQRPGCVITAAVLAMLAMPAAPASAAEPSDWMPSGTLFYVSWPGAGALGEASRDTAWGKMLAEPRMGEFRQHWRGQLWPAIDKLIRGEITEERDTRAYEAALALLDALWSKPVVMGVADISMGEDVPTADLGLVIQAGEDAARLATHLDTLLSTLDDLKNPPREVQAGSSSLKEIADLDGFPIYYGRIADNVVICMGSRLKDFWTARAPGKALTGDERFVAASTSVEASAVSPMLYIDLAGAFSTLEEFQPWAAKDEIPILGEPGGVRKLLTQIGLDRLRSFAIAMRPGEDGFRTVAFLHAPGIGRGGGLFGQKPLTDDDLRLVPRRVYMASIDNFDFAAMYQYLSRCLETFSPDLHEKATAILHDFEHDIGFKIHDDLLAAFADTWILYDAPDHAGLWFIGHTLIGELRPGRSLQPVLEKALAAINKAWGEGKLILRSEEHDGQKVHFVEIQGLPLPLAPAWTEYNGRWILALSPQVVEIVLDHQKNAAASLLDNADFQRGRKLLPDRCSSIGYTDAAVGIKQLHTTIQALLQGAAMPLREAGIPVDLRTLPPAGTLTRHMFGTVAGMVTVEEGVLSVQHSAYPLTMAGSTIGAAAGGMAGSTLLPSLTRARSLARRTTAAAQLAEIGKAMHLYAADHEGRLPARLEVLVDEKLITREKLKSPADDSEEAVSYIYLGPADTSGDQRNVVAHERPGINDGEGSHVLFLDGHVEFLSPGALEEALSATKARLKRGEKHE